MPRTGMVQSLACGPGPFRLCPQRTGFALGHHPAAFIDFDMLEDAGREIGILRHVGVERGAMGHVEDEQAADHAAALEQRAAIDYDALLPFDELEMRGAMLAPRGPVRRILA